MKLENWRQMQHPRKNKYDSLFSCQQLVMLRSITLSTSHLCNAIRARNKQATSGLPKPISGIWVRIKAISSSSWTRNNDPSKWVHTRFPFLAVTLSQSAIVASSGMNSRPWTVFGSLCNLFGCEHALTCQDYQVRLCFFSYSAVQPEFSIGQYFPS